MWMKHILGSTSLLINGCGRGCKLRRFSVKWPRIYDKQYTKFTPQAFQHVYYSFVFPSVFEGSEGANKMRDRNNTLSYNQANSAHWTLPYSTMFGAYSHAQYTDTLWHGSRQCLAFWLSLPDVFWKSNSNAKWPIFSSLPRWHEAYRAVVHAVHWN